MDPRTPENEMIGRLHLPFSGVVEAVEDGIREGLHSGAQFYVSRHLEVLADAALGRLDEERPLTPDTLLPWMSSAKPVTAAAAAQLWEAGKLDLDDPVALHVPEFGVKGKEAVTIRHLLTHTAGFRTLDAGWPGLTWAQIIARICDMKLEPRWRPGRKAAYHRASSWFILGEIVQRLSATPFSRHVREKIFKPLGMQDAWIGMPAERYRSYGPRIGRMFDTASRPAQPLNWTALEWAVNPSPAGGALGPIRELGHFYEMLLSKGQRRGVRILTPQTAEALMARHRVGLYDHTFRHVVDWGLGLIPDSKQYGVDTVPYGYGRHCSSSTVGHSGYRSSTGFTDRENGLAAAFIFTGVPSAEAHERRMRRVLEALYEDLELAQQPPRA